MAITVADLLVKLGMDSDNFDRGTDEVHGKVGRFSGLLKAGMVAAASGAAAALGATFAATVNIEDALTPIGTLLGTTTPEFDKMSEAIKNVARSSPKTVDELGGAAYTILSAGITDATKAQLALSDSNKLALAGLGSVPEATDLVTSAMNSWKDANLSSTTAARFLFGTIQSGKTTTSQLAQGFGQIAPLAAGAGISMMELMSATAALTATGQPASVAYSGLRGAISNILNPTKEATEAAASLGIEFNSGALKSKGLSGFLNDLKSSMANAGISGSDATDKLTGMFGSVEALNAVMTLTGPQSDAFNANLVNIATSGKTLDERAKEVSETLSNRLAAAKNRAMIALSELGTRGLSWLTDMWERHGSSVTAVIDKLKLGFAVLANAFRGTLPDEGDTGGSSGFLLLMQKIGLTARNVVDTFVQNWPRIQEIIGMVAGVVSAYITNIWIPVFQVLVGVFQSIVQTVEENWPRIQSTITTVMTTVQGIIGAVGQFIRDHWSQISAVFEAVSGVIGANLTWMITVFSSFVAIVGFVWKNFGDEIMAVIGFVFDNVIPVITNALGVIQNIMEFFTNLLQGKWGEAWDSLKGIFTSAFATLWSIITGSFNMLWGLIGQFVGWGASFVSTLVSGLWNNVWQIGEWAAGLGTRVWNSIMGWFGDMVALGSNIIAGLMQGVYNMAGRLAGAVWDTVTGPFKAVGGWLRLGSPSRLMEEWGKYSMQGFEIGLTKEAANLTNAAVGSFGAVTAAAGIVNNRTSTAVSNGGPVSVSVNMPPGSNGDDVVRALRRWQDRNGALPVKVMS